MPLARKIYRGCKVWVEVDEAGRPVEHAGLVKIRYRQDAPETQIYSAKLAQVSDIDPNAPAPPKEAKAPRTRTEPSSATGDPAAGGGALRKRRIAGGVPRKRRPASAAGGEAVIIYADGSCYGNPGPAGVGVLLEWKGRVKELSQYLGQGTNNIAELTAIRLGLEQVKNRRYPVRVHTDSAYAIGVLSEGWKAKENRDLIASIQELMREFADLKFVKVRGHSGDPRNERVDQLARDAIDRRPVAER